MAENEVFDMIFTPFGGDYSKYGVNGGGAQAEHSFFDYKRSAPAAEEEPETGALSPASPYRAQSGEAQSGYGGGDGWDAGSDSRLNGSNEIGNPASGIDTYEIGDDSDMKSAKKGALSGMALGALGGVPGLGLAGTAIGTGMDISEQEKSLSKEGFDPDLSYFSALANNLSFGLFGTSAERQGFDWAVDNRFSPEQKKSMAVNYHDDVGQPPAPAWVNPDAPAASRGALQAAQDAEYRRSEGGDSGGDRSAGTGGYEDDEGY